MEYENDGMRITELTPDRTYLSHFIRVNLRPLHSLPSEVFVTVFLGLPTQLRLLI